MKLLFLHLVGCLYYCISDALSHKHQIHYEEFDFLIETESNYKQLPTFIIDSAQ